MRRTTERRARSITWGTCGLCVIVITVALYAGREKLLEQWYIHELHSEGEASKEAAAEKLWHMESPAVVPYRLTRWIERHYEPSDKGMHLDLRLDGKPLEVSLPCTVDVESGDGYGGMPDRHAGTSFWRFELHERGGEAEEVIWHHLSVGKPWVSARRTGITSRQVRCLLDAVRILPTISLNESGPQSKTFAGWGSGPGLFVLVRVLNSSGSAVFEKGYDGLRGSTEQLEYLPLQAVQEFFGEIARDRELWKQVAESDLRRTHFPDAVRLNRAYMKDPSFGDILFDCTWGLELLGPP